MQVLTLLKPHFASTFINTRRQLDRGSLLCLVFTVV